MEVLHNKATGNYIVREAGVQIFTSNSLVDVKKLCGDRARMNAAIVRGAGAWKAQK